MGSTNRRWLLSPTMSRLRAGMCSTVCARGSLSWSFALSSAASISASVVTTLCSAMMLLPKCYQFVEMSCGPRQNVAHIRLASVAWPYSVAPAGVRDLAVRAEVNDYLNLGVEAMHVPRLVVHCVGRKPNAVKTERAPFVSMIRSEEHTSEL